MNNPALLFNEIAHVASALVDLLYSSQFSDEGAGDFGVAICSMVQRIGLVADQAAKDYGGSQARGGLEEWILSPLASAELDEMRLQTREGGEA